MKKPQLSNEEFLLLQDAEARKKAVGTGPLVIKDRMIGGGGESQRLDDVALENIQFVDCIFIGHMMFDVDMKNISFERCVFTAIRWEGGKWFDLKFEQCGFYERDVKMLPGGGGGSTLLDRCYFRGTEPKNPAYADYLDFHGQFGVAGKGHYRECEFQRFDIFIDTHGEFEKCKCDRFGVSHRFTTGALSMAMDECTVTGELTMPNCIIQELRIKNSTFADKKVDAKRLKAQRVHLENTTGCFDFFASDLHELNAKSCTFLQSKDVGDKEETYGLGIAWTQIGSLVLDTCKFSGESSRLFAPGAEPARDQDGKVVYLVSKKTGMPESPYTEIDAVALRNTPLVHGNFTYSHIKQLTVEDSEVADTKFPHSKIGKLALKNVKLSGTLDFTDTQVKEVVAENVAKDKAVILKDKTSEVSL